MSLSLSSTLTAVATGITSSFLASGGTTPYTYSVLTGGAGGTIDASTGVYTAPSTMGTTPQTLYDTILVTDSSAKPLTAIAQILVGDPLILFCDVIQQGMGLANGRVYLWDQKIFQPTDFDLYIAVSALRVKPFGNSKTYDSNANCIQSVNVMATMSVDAISRGPAARDRKEEIIMALNSDYSALQQSANNFYIATLPTNFVDLSKVDGAAIPYRYNISVNIQYLVKKTPTINTYGNFSDPQLVVDP